MESRAWVGVALVKLAAVYLVASLLLGLAMAIRKDFALMSVHSHLGLLGWTAMGLTGLVYLVRPSCARSRLSVAHFWLHNLGLPLMMGSLAAELLGRPGGEPLIGAGAVLVLAGLGLFAVNVVRSAGV
jgi:hypothetical protein